MMSLPTIRTIIEWAKVHSIGEITLLGGEPSLHPDIDEIVNACRMNGLDPRLVTNGSPRMQALLQGGRLNAGNISRVAVSLDSADAAVQDRMRGHGAHADATRTIEALRVAEIPLDINVTGTSSAMAGIQVLFEYAENVGCRRVNIHWPSAMGLGSSLPSSDIPTREEWERLVNLVRTYRPRGNDFFIEIERAFLSDDEALTSCALAEATNLQVMPDGRVYRCGLLVDDPSMAALFLRGGRIELADEISGEELLRQALATNCDSCPAVTDTHNRRACIYDKVKSGCSE